MSSKYNWISGFSDHTVCMKMPGYIQYSVHSGASLCCLLTCRIYLGGDEEYQDISMAGVYPIDCVTVFSSVPLTAIVICLSGRFFTEFELRFFCEYGLIFRRAIHDCCWIWKRWLPNSYVNRNTTIVSPHCISDEMELAKKQTFTNLQLRP